MGQGHVVSYGGLGFPTQAGSVHGLCFFIFSFVSVLLLVMSPLYLRGVTTLLCSFLLFCTHDFQLIFSFSHIIVIMYVSMYLRLEF